MAPVLLIVAATLIYLLLVVYPRVMKRGRRKLEHRDHRFRNRLMAVAEPDEDEDV